MKSMKERMRAELKTEARATADLQSVIDSEVSTPAQKARAQKMLNDLQQKDSKPTEQLKSIPTAATATTATAAAATATATAVSRLDGVLLRFREWMIAPAGQAYLDAAKAELPDASESEVTARATKLRDQAAERCLRGDHV